MTDPAIVEILRRLDAIEARLGPSAAEIRKQRTIALGLRFDVLNRDQFRCTYCGATGTSGTLRVDHIVPVSKGGKSTMANLTTACEPCNAGKADKALHEARAATMRAKGNPGDVVASRAEAEAFVGGILTMLEGK